MEWVSSMNIYPTTTRHMANEVEGTSEGYKQIISLAENFNLITVGYMKNKISLVNDWSI